MLRSRFGRRTWMLCLLVFASAPLMAQARGATLDAVRLRATPAATGAAVRTLDIAAPLVVEGTAAGEWVRVRTADGARGWVRRDLTVPYDAANPLPALRTITARSVAQKQAPFATRTRLVNVLSDVAGAAAATEEQSRAPEARFCTDSGADDTVKPDRIAALGRTVAASAGADKARAATLVRTLARRCT